MFKKTLQSIKNPFGWALKFSLVSSLFIATVPLLAQVFTLFAGNVGFGDVLSDMARTYVIAYGVQLFLYAPWIFLYGGVKLFFQTVFPKALVTPVKKRTGVNQAQPVTLIQRRKEVIQATILGILGENKGHLDIEDVHLLERIHEELLTKTEKTFDALADGGKSSYEQAVLTRFDELEGKILEIKAKLERQKERHLDKQLEIIDQITK